MLASKGADSEATAAVTPLPLSGVYINIPHGRIGGDNKLTELMSAVNVNLSMTDGDDEMDQSKSEHEEASDAAAGLRVA